MAKLCSVEGCTYEKIPQSTKFCWWHRLMKTSPQSQDRARERRLALATEDSTYELKSRVSPTDWPAGERWCTGCQSFIPLFYCTGSRCKPCAKKSAQVRMRETTYGLTEKSHGNLEELQDGRCAICRKRQVSKALAVDHNHKTGDVRGLLCSRCNHDLLGAAHESVRILLAAAAYLAAPPANGEWLDPEKHGEALLRGFMATIDALQS